MPRCLFMFMQSCSFYPKEHAQLQYRPSNPPLGMSIAERLRTRLDLPTSPHTLERESHTKREFETSGGRGGFRNAIKETTSVASWRQNWACSCTETPAANNAKNKTSSAGYTVQLQKGKYTIQGASVLAAVVLSRRALFTNILNTASDERRQKPAHL